MIEKNEIQQTQVEYKKDEEGISVVGIWRSSRPMSSRQILWGVIQNWQWTAWTWTSNWYIQVIIWWKVLKLMTRA